MFLSSLKSLLFLCVQIHFAFTCDESKSDVTDTSHVSGEYLNIFQTIPTLFEYVMDVIEEKPEILEKDDVTVFTRDSGTVAASDVVEEAGDSSSLQSLDSDENDDEDDYELQGYPDSDFWDWYIGAKDSKVLSLTSSEIAEKALEIERQLEEYNAAKS